MKIVMTGGGSGGHITPILAVAHEVKRLQPSAQISYIGQHGEGLLDVLQADPNLDAVHVVSAGKFRRYSGAGWKQLLDIKTQFLNIRDAFRVLRGVGQSYRLLGDLKPDVIFTRGGFVSVPVALAAKLRHIPYITHDSDSTPSLANRIIARWAAAHAVALPPEIYPYPRAKTFMTGIPLSNKYVPVTTAIRSQYRAELGLEEYKQILFITGGGNGARRLNQDIVANTRYLLGNYTELYIVHVAGRTLIDETAAAYDALDLGIARSRVKVEGFISNLHLYSGAADVIIARGGATNLAEFALQGAACLIVPSEQLGWNVQNSHTLAERSAVIELTDAQAEQPERLGRAVGELLDDATKRQLLGHALSQMARPDAAVRLATMLVEIAKGGPNALSK